MERAHYVVASAVSAKRTVLVEVGPDGYVSGVRLLSDCVRRWDTYEFGERVVAVSAVAHDRYLAGLPHADGRFASLSDVDAAERKLVF